MNVELAALKRKAINCKMQRELNLSSMKVVVWVRVHEIQFSEISRIYFCTTKMMKSTRVLVTGNPSILIRWYVTLYGGFLRIIMWRHVRIPRSIHYPVKSALNRMTGRQQCFFANSIVDVNEVSISGLDSNICFLCIFFFCCDSGDTNCIV